MALAREGRVEGFIEMGFDPLRTLHGKQRFQYFSPICAGDIVRMDEKIVDVYQKKGGALDFVLTETIAALDTGEIAQKMNTTLVIRREVS